MSVWTISFQGKRSSPLVSFLTIHILQPHLQVLLGMRGYQWWQGVFWGLEALHSRLSQKIRVPRRLPLSPAWHSCPFLSYCCSCPHSYHSMGTSLSVDRPRMTSPVFQVFRKFREMVPFFPNPKRQHHWTFWHWGDKAISFVKVHFSRWALRRDEVMPNAWKYFWKLNNTGCCQSFCFSWLCRLSQSLSFIGIPRSCWSSQDMRHHLLANGSEAGEFLPPHPCPLLAFWTCLLSSRDKHKVWRKK